MNAKRKENYKKSKQNRMNHLKVQRKWYKNERGKTDRPCSRGRSHWREDEWVCRGKMRACEEPEPWPFLLLTLPPQDVVLFLLCLLYDYGYGYEGEFFSFFLFFFGGWSKIFCLKIMALSFPLWTGLSFVPCLRLYFFPTKICLQTEVNSSYFALTHLQRIHQI